MANTFTRKYAAAIGTTPTVVGSYTVPAATTTIVIGMSVSNITNNTVAVDIKLVNGATEIFIAKAAPIPAGGAMVPYGGDQKLVLITSDSVKVTSDTASSIDVVMSILEQT
jgi:hypothetical protein